MGMEKQNNLSVLKENTEIEALTQLFKVLSDPTRMRILLLISLQEKCVNEVADELNMSEAAVSHHLRILRMNDLVRYRRDGKLIFYELDDDHVRLIMAQGKEHVNEKKVIFWK